MTTNKDFQEFQKFLTEQKQHQIDEVLGAALKSAGKMAAATSALSGGVAAGQTAAQGGSKDDVVKAGIEGAKSIVTEPVRKYKEGDKWGAATDVLTTVSPTAALTDLARLGAQTDTGRSIGKWIADNIPGAKTAADTAKKFRETIGMKSSFEPKEPEQPKEPEPASDMVARKVQSIPITPPTQQTSTTDEIVPRKVKTTIERESGGRTIKSFKQFHKNK